MNKKAIFERLERITDFREFMIFYIIILGAIGMTYAVPDNQELCIERADATATPSNSFTAGGDNEVMLVRACMIVDRVLPFSGFGLNLTRDDSGGLHMMASSVFVNEPD